MAKKVVTKKKETPTDLTQSEHVGAALTVGDGTAWGAEEVTSEDILIPRIMLMQPSSKLVNDDGIAKFGEFRDSLNKDVLLGDEKNPVEFIPFYVFKTWRIFKSGEYLKTERYSVHNKDWAYEEVNEDGEVIQRTKVFNVYVLLASNPEFPYLLTFKSTSFMAGKKLSTYFQMAKAQKLPPASSTYFLSSEKTKNDKGSFAITDVTPGRKTTNEELAKAWEWYKTLTVAEKNNSVKLDDGDDSLDATDTSSTPPRTANNTSQQEMQV